MLKKILFSVALITITCSIGLLSINNSALAQNTGTGFIPQATGEQSANCHAPADSGMDDKTYCGDYAVSDFLSIAIIASQWILGIVGSLALIMFIYGGFMFLISAGSSDKVGQAKKILVAAIIGLIIVFSSWLIIKFVTGSIGAKKVFNGTVSLSSYLVKI